MDHRLFTERLVLAPASAEQIRAIIAGEYERASKLIGARVPPGWPDDPAAQEGLPWHLAALEQDANQALWRIRLVINVATDSVIGSINLKGPPTQEGDVEIGWGILAEARGQGFAIEASRSVVEWAFADSSVRRVTATVPEHNKASQRVASRLGMAPTGETRRGLPVWAIGR